MRKSTVKPRRKYGAEAGPRPPGRVVVSASDRAGGDYRFHRMPAREETSKRKSGASTHYGWGSRPWLINVSKYVSSNCSGGGQRMSVP